MKKTMKKLTLRQESVRILTTSPVTSVITTACPSNHHICGTTPVV